MSECPNPDCKKKKLIDGFPVLKEGNWSMRITDVTLSPEGEVDRSGSVRLLKFTNDGCGFVHSNNGETVNAIGTWKKSYKSYDLYLVINDANGGNFIVSASGYKDGEISEIIGIHVVGGLIDINTNQVVGQVELQWAGNTTI